MMMNKFCHFNRRTHNRVLAIVCSLRISLCQSPWCSASGTCFSALWVARLHELCYLGNKRVYRDEWWRSQAFLEAMRSGEFHQCYVVQNLNSVPTTEAQPFMRLYQMLTIRNYHYNSVQNETWGVFKLHSGMIRGESHQLV